MSVAADWGIPTPAQGMPIAPFATPFQLQGDAIAVALDTLKGFAYPRYAKRSDLPSSNIPLYTHSTVTNDSNTSLNGDYIYLSSGWQKSGGNAAQIGQVIGVTSNGNGDVTVNHSLGIEPRFIGLTWIGSAGAASFDPRIYSKNATSFVVRIFYNSVAWAGQSIAAPNGFMWKAEA